MHLLIVNSNTSPGITRQVATEAWSLARAGAVISAVTAPYGVPAIETPEDARIAAAATCDAIRSAGPVDAAIIACFSDPGLVQIREEVAFPVIGIAEAAMLDAAAMGDRFAILTVAPTTIPGIRQTADEYGVAGQLTGVHALNRGVLDSHADPGRTLKDMTDLAQAVLSAEKPDVLVLGGAVTAGMTRHLAHLIPVPLIDGLGCAMARAGA
ncbi:aspartate/glutamate racemase family protein [Chachezhania sediminis]|uniref:aspartate/glutamate racemase family protein n=1 Tax=Chachezhania sediminis TaxID=2599291 RepID=UPI00131BC9A0|nr:aspartate/glutamate racemase family protein [Chachezhania sediminis]